MIVDLKLVELAKSVVGNIPLEYEFIYYFCALFLFFALCFFCLLPFLFLIKLIK